MSPMTNIGSSVASGLTTAFANQADVTVADTFKVDSQDTDGSGGQKEFTWQNTYWSTDYGFYNSIPEFKTAVDAKANWVVGAGFTAQPEVERLLLPLNGNGKDSFNSILKSMIKCKTISADSFAEVIRDKNGFLANVKPLDPASMKIVQNDKGRIIRYEQVSKTKIPDRRFKPEQIFHLSHERMADEIHGTRIIPSLQFLILARNEALNDWKRVLHRNVDPLWIFHLDTDDATEINTFKGKMDSARAGGENMYIPKGAVVPELVTTASNATLNPLSWINQLNDYFFQAVMVPQIVIGNAKEFTDASGKIVYLAFEQAVKAEQLYIEEQVLGQLNLEIQLTFPASLQNEAISDQPAMELEEEPQEQAVQPNDVTEELEGRE